MKKMRQIGSHIVNAPRTEEYGVPELPQRAWESEKRVAVGGADMFEARCGASFVPHADGRRCVR
jgi:hypothetical protein